MALSLHENLKRKDYFCKEIYALKLNNNNITIKGMAYRFKHVEHQIYKNTFLKDVRIAVEFAPIGVDAIDADKMQAYFSKFDGANIQVSDFLSRKNINIFLSITRFISDSVLGMPRLSCVYPRTRRLRRRGRSG